MIHLRVVCPTETTPSVRARLAADPAVANLALVAGASIAPAGDLILCDIAREGVNGVIEALRELDVHRTGSISVEQIEVSVSDAARDAERRVAGYGSDAAVWEEVDARVRDDSELTAGFVAFIVLAALIAVIGIVEDSSILIVGAMVVGPEFGPIAGLAVGLFKRRANRIRTASATLGAGLVFGVVAAYAGTVAGRAAGLIPPDLSPHDQPITGFIVEPSALSFVVALLAGVAGTLSLTQAKAGALIGVLISVTTIPAVAAIGVSLAVGQAADVWGATVQLLMNVVALLIAAVATLVVQRAAWERLAVRRTRRS